MPRHFVILLIIRVYLRIFVSLIAVLFVLSSTLRRLFYAKTIIILCGQAVARPKISTPPGVCHCHMCSCRVSSEVQGQGYVKF